MRKLLLLILILIGIQGHAKVYTPDNLPVHANADSAHVSYISDPDHLLSHETYFGLNARLRSLEQHTSVKSLIVVVRTIGSVESYDFSMELARKYKVGTTDNTGFIVTVVVDDHKWSILTGEGLEKYLTDALCSKIGRLTLVPYMKKDDLDGGLTATLNDIIQILEGDEELRQWYDHQNDEKDALVGSQTASDTSSDGEDDDLWSLIMGCGLFGYWVSCLFIKPRALGCVYAILLCPFFPFILLIEFLITLHKKRAKRCSHCGKKGAKYTFSLGDWRQTSYYKCPHCGQTTKKTISHIIHYDTSDLDSSGGGGYSGGSSSRSSSSYSSHSHSSSSSRSYGSSGGGSFGGGGASGRW